jgi:putative DNA primase/helicase
VITNATPRPVAMVTAMERKIVSLVDKALADDPLTEDALALRFSERHMHDLRFVATKEQWFIWDGVRWRPEQTYRAFDLARASCRADAKEFGNGKPERSIYTAKTFAAVERITKTDRRQAATLDQFDVNDLMFTTGE